MSTACRSSYNKTSRMYNDNIATKKNANVQNVRFVYYNLMRTPKT